ncbi:MAG: DUF6691 family protein [Ekhidna sp.]
MKLIKYLLVGIVFGIVLSKSEVISWFRIYEMFRFESFHMYGVIGSSVILGMFFIQMIKRSKMKSIDGDEIHIQPKEKSFKRYLFGGTIFGLGWALTGACPGPMFIILGNGMSVFIVVIASALLGTYTYGILKNKLPH